MTENKEKLTYEEYKKKMAKEKAVETNEFKITIGMQGLNKPIIHYKKIKRNNL